MHGEALTVSSSGVIKAKPAKLRVATKDSYVSIQHSSEHRAFLPGTALMAYIPVPVAAPDGSNYDYDPVPSLLKIKVNWYNGEVVVPYAKYPEKTIYTKNPVDGVIGKHPTMPEIEPGTFNFLLKRGEYMY